MLNQLTLWLLVSCKFALPVAIVFWPFAAGWANFVLDSIDGDLLIPLGLPNGPYQLIDKAADWLTYVGMAVAAWHWRWPIKRWIYGLFAFRTVGQLAFFLTGDERVFFLFPNFLEPLFLIFATIVFFRKDQASRTYHKWRILIWVFVIVYKLQDEYVTHISNVDRSELIQKILGM